MNRRTRERADLQSAAINHSATLPSGKRPFSTLGLTRTSIFNRILFYRLWYRNLLALVNPISHDYLMKKNRPPKKPVSPYAPQPKPKKTGFNADRPTFSKSDRPSYGKSDRPSYGKSERPAFGDKKPRFDKRSDKKPSFVKKAEFRQDQDSAADTRVPRTANTRTANLRTANPRNANTRTTNLRNAAPRAAAPRAYEKPTHGNDLLWGLHAVREAWLNKDRRCLRLCVTEAGLKAMEATLAEANDDLLKRPTHKVMERPDLDRLLPPGSVHQGIVLEAEPLREPSLHDVIAGDNPPDILLMLDQVTDPHNVGAILRSAAAFGAGAVIMTERNAPNTTGVLAKTASGALEHIPMIHVVNLARTLDDLQNAGYWSVGLAEEGEKDLGEHDLSSRIVLVLGAEGDGLRQLTRKKCDELARLPTGGAIGSLNVSNAAAVALYETRRQKSKFEK